LRDVLAHVDEDAVLSRFIRIKLTALGQVTLTGHFPPKLRAARSAGHQLPHARDPQVSDVIQ
jgi:hypothetical protein